MPYHKSEWLFNQYCELKKSSLQIAQELSVTKGTILIWLKKHNIPIRTLSQAQIISLRSHKFKTGKSNPMYGKKPLRPFKKGDIPWNLGKKHTEQTKEKIQAKSKGKKHSFETKNKMRISHLGKGENEKNPAWKGVNVNHRSVHEWIRHHKPKSEECEICHKKNEKLELSCKNHLYERKIDDYWWLCVKCHRNYDNQNFGSYQTPWNMGLPREDQPMYNKKHLQKSKEMMSETKRRNKACVSLQ